jgi:hypothetical protein
MEQEKNEPVYWFIVLERAVKRGDYDIAAHAQRELNRLGVKVAYRKVAYRAGKAGAAMRPEGVANA